MTEYNIIQPEVMEKTQLDKHKIISIKIKFNSIHNSLEMFLHLLLFIGIRSTMSGSSFIQIAKPICLKLGGQLGVCVRA